MMTQGSRETTRASRSQNLDSKRSPRMVSPCQDSTPLEVTGSQPDSRPEVQEQPMRSFRSKARRSSFPKRQLSRTDSTMVELTTETLEPIVLRRSSDIPDVSDVARRNAMDLEQGAHRRGSIKKKLTRTDSTVMVVTSDPDNLALKIQQQSLDEVTDDDIDSLLEDLEVPAVTIPQAAAETRDIPKPPRSPPILVSEHIDGRRARKYKQHSTDEDLAKMVPNGIERKHLEGTIPNSNSCPNLMKDHIPSPTASKIRSARSSEGNLGAEPQRRESDARRSSSTQLLQVPDVFTTSFQSSIKNARSMDEIPLGNQGSHKVYRYSAPELTGLDNFTAENEQPQPCQQSLVKSLSDNPTQDRRSKLKTLSDSRILMFQSADDVHETTRPFTPILSQVTEGVFIGNIESTSADRLLCKHRIGSVVDVSGCPPEAVPAHKRSNVPCACGNETRHQRAFLRLCLADANPGELHALLKNTNKFIKGARGKSKAVLVTCYYGNQWSALVVIHYLMTIKRMNLRKAYSTVMLHRSDLELTPDMKNFLQQVERRLFEPEDQSLCFERAADRNNSLLPREAWVDEPKDF